MKKEEAKDTAMVTSPAAAGGTIGGMRVRGLQNDGERTVSTHEEKVAEEDVIAVKTEGTVMIDDVVEVYGGPPEVEEWEKKEEIDDMMVEYGGPNMLKEEKYAPDIDDMAPMYGPPIA